MYLQSYGDQRPVHQAVQDDAGADQPVVLAAEWTVDLDQFGATIDVTLSLIGYNDGAVDQGGALLLYFGTTPGTLGTFQAILSVSSIDSGTPAVDATSVTSLTNPGGVGLVQLGLRRGLTPDDSASVPVFAWGLLVHLETTP